MSSLEQAKTLGGVGSIFMLLGIVPAAGVILFIVGFILVLIAVKDISENVEDKTIFNNMLIAVVLAIVGIIVGAVLFVGRLFPYFREFRGTPYNYNPWMMEPNFFATIIIALVIVWVFSIVSVKFLRKSYTEVAARLNVKMFETAALLYLIGAVLTIILVGFIILYVAGILQTVAFFSIPEKTQQPAQAQA